MSARQVAVLGLAGLHLDLVAGRQERVEADNELGMPAEERGHAANHARCVNTLRLKLLQNNKWLN